MKTQKLIKDCKVGDILYYVEYSHGRENDIIVLVSIDKIETNPYMGDTYTCSAIGGKHTITFTNVSTKHDSLSVDMDYEDVKLIDCHTTAKVFTTYKGASDWLMTELKYSIMKQLDRLERFEMKNGTTDNIFQKKTIEYEKDYHTYKKIEIYDCGSWEKPKDIDKILKGKKIKVYKKHIETDFYGCQKGYTGQEFFVKDFDSEEEALQYIFKHDKSRYHGKLNSWYEGDTYFMKIEKDNK